MCACVVRPSYRWTRVQPQRVSGTAVGSPFVVRRRISPSALSVSRLSVNRGRITFYAFVFQFILAGICLVACPGDSSAGRPCRWRHLCHFHRRCPLVIPLHLGRQGGGGELKGSWPAKTCACRELDRGQTIAWAYTCHVVNWHEIVTFREILDAFMMLACPRAHTYKHTDTHIHTHRGSNARTHACTERETQTDRQTHRQRQRERVREAGVLLYHEILTIREIQHVS